VAGFVSGDLKCYLSAECGRELVCVCVCAPLSWREEAAAADAEAERGGGGCSSGAAGR